MNNMLTIKARCPECGQTHKRKIVRISADQHEHIKQVINVQCRNCAKKGKNTLGYDNILKTTPDSSLCYISTTCSGVENEWHQENLRCPVCKQFVGKVESGDYGDNQKCTNHECPIIGFDFQRSPNEMIVTASGIYQTIQNFIGLRQ